MLACPVVARSCLLAEEQDDQEKQLAWVFLILPR